MPRALKPTSRTQPYRKGARHPGPVLSAMLRGRTAFGQNPQDHVRRMQKRHRQHRRYY